MKTPLELLRDDVAERAEKAQTEFCKFDLNPNCSMSTYYRLDDKSTKLYKFLDKLDIMLEDIKFNFLED